MTTLTERPEFAKAHQLIRTESGGSLQTVCDALRLASFSDTGEGIVETAQHFADLLSRVCSDARAVPTAGNPIVFGTVPASKSNMPTLLIYGLYDVTPTISDEWSVDPLGAEIVDAGDLGLLPHLGPVVAARGANNHKGPVVSSILAVDSLLRSGAEMPVNLIFVIEGEEEIGSPSLPAFVREHADVLERADGVWLPCMQQNSAGVMTLRRSYKGTLFAHLTCRGGDWGGPSDGRHIWAGNSAWIDAPMMQLVRALSTLYDAEQHATIDGLEALENSTAAEHETAVEALSSQFRAHPSWQDNMLGNLNVNRPLADKEIADWIGYYMTGVTMNIQGITGGYQGPTFYTMLPGQASARVDFRFPPGISLEEFCSILRAHLDRRGFAHVELEMPRGYAGAPAMPPGQDYLLDAAVRTAERFGVDTSVWPIANNCCPGSLFTALGRQIPFSVAGIGHGDRAHAPDEYFTVPSVEKLMHFTIEYLADFADTLQRREA